MRAYRLPGGGHTTDPQVYGQAWKALGEKCERFFRAYEVTGYDPGIQLARRDRYGVGRQLRENHFTIPAEAALDLTAPTEGSYEP